MIALLRISVASDDRTTTPYKDHRTLTIKSKSTHFAATKKAD